MQVKEITVEDFRNGFGYEYSPKLEMIEPRETIFPSQAMEIVDQTLSDGSCYVWGDPGAGKSHLVKDLFVESQNRGIPVISIAAHINGGSKKGAVNSEYVLDTFVERHPRESLIIVDNIDYYGYSGSRAHRRYGVAEAHLRVAKKLINLIEVDTSAAVCGLSHTQSWRDAHWKFKDKRGEEDKVSGTAQLLLDSFKGEYVFDGRISEEVAMEILTGKSLSLESASKIIAELRMCRGELLFRHVNHLAIDPRTRDVLTSVNIIDQHTQRLIGGLASQKSLGLA